jgi:hypothetical protein
MLYRKKHILILSVSLYDLLLVARTTVLANSVRNHKSSALAALYESGCRHLPVSSSLVSVTFG